MGYLRMILLFLASSIAVCQQNILAVADFNNYQSSGMYYGNNFAGIGVNFSEIYVTAMNLTLFQGYFANAKAYGSTYSMMPMSLKMQYPKGYKYNCSAYTAIGINPTCTYNYQPIMSKISTFCKATGPYSFQKVAIGFDVEGANFSNPNFITYFSSFVSTLYSTIGSSYYRIPVEVFDGADTYGVNNIMQNYTAQNFVTDMTSILTQVSSNYFYGPGASQYADSSWLDTYNTLKSYQFFVFTVKCLIFNTTNITVSDVLNESNYRSFIVKRFTSNGQMINPVGGNIMITEALLCPGYGVDGVTNGLVSALWAIDFSIEFALFGGKGIKFVTDIATGNYHSMLGPAPTYAPNPIYYGLLFLSTLSYNSPIIGTPQVTAGSSQNIKIYGMTITNQLQIVMINKDTNSSATGVVQIIINSSDIIQCLYLTGASLSATTNITWAGFKFIGGTSVPQGNYTIFRYFPSNGTYFIPLAYAQAAVCYLGNPGANFPVMEKNEKYASLFLLIILLVFCSI
jgi:hypothetical protein